MDAIIVGSKVSSVNVSPAFDIYTKVIIHISDDEQITVGNDTGRTLEFDNPFGSESMAQRILDSLQGFRYQPYQADGALLDPAAEIGDALKTTTSYGGIYTRSRNFGRLMKADISAPHDEEIDHEYKFESPTERKFKREVGQVRASLIIANTMIQSEVDERKAEGEVLASRITQTNNTITAEVSRLDLADNNLMASLSIAENNIAAKVSASGGNNSSFGWKLTESSHSWYSGNTEVMKISASGLMVKGEVQATSGKIGGFTIGASAIYNNISQFGGTQNSGVYLGTNGIQLGQNFKVDSSGNVTASNMTLKGTLTFLNSDGTTAGTMSAANLKTGAEQAYNNYGSWNSAYSSTAPGGYCYGGAGGGYSWTSTKSAGTSSRPNIFVGSASCSSVATSSFLLGSRYGNWATITIDGTTRTFLVGN